ncbi:MAG: hypothetical protein AAFO91_04885 [Bacteroidota bacterium]
MQRILVTSSLDIGTDQTHTIECIEASPLKNILYVSLKVDCQEFPKGLPVLVIDLSFHNIKSRSFLYLIEETLETRNTSWISSLKRLSFCDSVFLAVGGDQKILDLFYVHDESPGEFQMSRSKTKSQTTFPTGPFS